MAAEIASCTGSHVSASQEYTFHSPSRKEMLELHYPTVTKTILERQYPGKITVKVAFGNGNGAIFENSSKSRASLFVTSRWPRSSGQTNYPPPPWWCSGCCTSSRSLVTYIENFASKVEGQVEAWNLLDGEKVEDCEYVFGSSTTFQRRKEWIFESRCRQVSVRLDLLWDFFALKPFHDYSLCSVCILPQPAFYSQSAVYILNSVCILPLVRSLQSAVCSPQSAFYTDRNAMSKHLAWESRDGAGKNCTIVSSF